MLLFVGCVLASHLNFANYAQIDCEPAPYAAWSLVTKGNFDLRTYHDLDELPQNVFRVLPDGTRLSRYPPGSSVMAVPVVALPALIHGEPLSRRGMARLGKLTGSLCLAASAVMFHALVLRLAPAAAWPATVLLAFGTCLFSVAGQGLWQHGPAAMWITAAIWLLLSPSPSPIAGEDGNAVTPVTNLENRKCKIENATCKWLSRISQFALSIFHFLFCIRPCPSPLTPLAAGICLGMAVLCRPSSVLFALAAGAALLLSRQWREALFAAAGGAVPVGLLALYNFVHYGEPAGGGYSDELEGWHTPIWLGLAGLLFAPSRGLLVYSPALLLAPLGLWAAVRTESSPQRTMIAALSAAAGATVLLYSRWYMWWGGWCFGPRFLIETLPVFCLLFAFGYARLRRPWARRAAIALVGLSVFVHFLGAYGNDDTWHERHHLSDRGACMFRFDDTQIEAHFRKFLRLDAH